MQHNRRDTYGQVLYRGLGSSYSNYWEISPAELDATIEWIRFRYGDSALPGVSCSYAIRRAWLRQKARAAITAKWSQAKHICRVHANAIGAQLRTFNKVAAKPFFAQVLRVGNKAKAFCSIHERLPTL